ncbi:uncharacterized protein LOC130378566 isoform X2 [Gadus chalcogrammus]|uniref:uncharacterized protein LOC130378566 isoform X2 n=1 Tax=Gadus chalcogrammus TaxID=1042646 RepID=UPI0024C3AB11|nr:uncharacterized protein LOC130378566 isoform X2 [Gadus chalcogrammus]
MLGVNFQVDVKDTFTNMTEKLTEFPFLRVTPPLHLKAAGQHGPLPVLLSEDNLGICLCKDKQQPKQIHVMNFLSGKEELVDLEELASRIGNLSDDQKLLTCRTPKEAILVLMDTSSSMEEECELKMRKIDAVKELFDSFASRTMAYDFYHVIGLMGFSTDVKLLHTFKETLETFKQSLRNLQPNGRTVLYDALQQGVKEMEEVKKRFPDCRLRIICLTDGNNVGSTVKPETVAVNLIKSNIIVDSVLIGKVDNSMLHGISIATGGCCFKPETLTDGLKLFECETVLSLEMRKPRKKLDPSSITSETVLTSIFAQQGYDDLPETSLPSGFNNTVTVAQNAFKSLRSKKYSSMERGKRVLEELRILHCHPHPYFSVFPSDSDFSFWKILMQGPPATPYENGTFKLYCQFGPDYPVKPPTIRFVTAIYHCNINSSGRICHNIFDHGYNAHITMKEILEAVYGLLIAPEADDPLDSILAEKLVSSREEYTQEARDQTAKTAAKSFDEMEQELVGQVPVPMAPRHLSCFITGKLFVDPVKTKYHTVYERRAIEDFLKTGMFDPQMGKDFPFGLSDLIPDPEMKQRLTIFRLHQIVSKLTQRGTFAGNDAIRAFAGSSTCSPPFMERQHFSNQLECLGLKLREIIEDGNCLFRALGDQLEGHSRGHLELRKETIQYMRSHPKDFESFVSGVSYADHLSELAQWGTFAGAVAIQAFASRRKLKVVIHQLNSKLLVRSSSQIQDLEKHACIELHIAFCHGNHYDSVRRIGDDSETPAQLRIEELVPKTPSHLLCSLTGKIIVDPVKTKYDTDYERRAIEEYLKTGMFDPQMGKDYPLGLSDLIPDPEMKKRVAFFRLHQIE